VLADTSPTLGDTAPTLATRPEGASAADEHGAAPSAEAGHGESSSSSAETAASEEACATRPSTPPPTDAAGEFTDRIGNALAGGCPPAPTPVNADGDALAQVMDGTGKLVPLQTAEGGTSEEALAGRLGDRRAELDRREAELAMRASLLEAAEKRLDDKAKELATLEARVAALVDEKQAAEEAGFKAVVSMYETMKPKEAARIFDALELPVLLKVARAMSPRKMSPILAAMSARPAEALTVALAATGTVDTVADIGENLAALPRIVGQ
jgi:flagellar motility protein MotE (MotC chaperone)